MNRKLEIGPSIGRAAGTFWLLLAGALVAVCARADGLALAPASSVPATVLRDELAAGVRTAEAVTRHFLDRIAERDVRHRSVLAVAPDALEQARLLDRRFAEGGAVGPLHGMPVLLKDNIESRELPTTAGSLALADNHTGRDAPLVARLRAAGAIILGKTNLSEWANFRSRRSSSGWSTLGGQTTNAVDPQRSPCGSSSGSAVAVALGFAPLTVGTETNGSIVCPAAMNGVVGFKPTVGLVSRRGIVPISLTQDTAGPMARDLAGARLLLAAMAGIEADDPMAALPGTATIDEESSPRTLTGLRFGVLRTATGYHEGVDALFEAALGRLTAAGVELVDVAIDRPDGMGTDTRDILLHEFRSGIERYLGTLAPPMNAWTLDTLIAFNRDHAQRTMPWFRQELFLAASEVVFESEADYEAALARVRGATREAGIDRLLAEHDVVAIVAPTRGPAWMIDLVNGDNFGGGFSTYPAVSGYPHLTLPMGRVHDLPVGLSLTAGAGSDADLLAIGAAVEALGVAGISYP